VRVLFYVVHHVCSLWIWMYFEGNEPTVMRYDAQASGASSSSFLLCVCVGGCSWFVVGVAWCLTEFLWPVYSGSCGCFGYFWDYLAKLT